MILKLQFSQFIRENKNENIISLLKNKYKLNVTSKYGLYLIRYTNQSDIENSLVRECKNIVCDSCFNIISITRKFNVTPEQFNDLPIPDWRKNVQVSQIIEGDYVYLFYHNDNWYISTKKSIFNSSTKLYQTVIKVLTTKIPLSKLNNKYCYTFILTTPPYQRLYLTNCFKINNLSIEETTIEPINIGLFKNKLPLVKILYNFNKLADIYDYLKQLKNHNRQHMINGFILKYEQYQCKITMSNINVVNNKYNNHRLISRDTLRKITKELQKYYHSYFVKKTIDFSKVPIKYKKHCYNLHKDFIYKMIPENYVSKEIVKKYLNYLSNYEKRLLLKSSKVDCRSSNLNQNQQSIEEIV
jgi:hypothetical protein